MAIIYWYIRDFFLFIGNVVSFAFDLIWQVILILVECVKFLVSVITSLPPLFLISATALIVICVLYKVLGRESSS